MSRNKAFEAENGFLVENGPHYSGGAASPVGSIAGLAGDFYVQTTGTKPVIWFSTGPSVNDWRLARISDLLNVHSILNHTSTLDGTDSLTVDSVNIHRIIGTATGFSIQLPDASTLSIGRRFEISNESSESIFLKDGSGATLFTLISGDYAIVTLETDGSAAGNWIVTITGSAATGIASYTIGSTTPFITSSTTDVLITGMSVTPVSGRYALWYSSDITISNNNQDAQIVIYQNGSALERTRRTTQGVSSNFNASHSTIAEVNVNGSETIDIRVNVTSGTLDTNSRRLILIRLGS